MHTACASAMAPSLRSVSGLALLGLLVCLAPAVQGETSFWPRFRAQINGRRGGSRATGATNKRGARERRWRLNPAPVRLSKLLDRT